MKRLILPIVLLTIMAAYFGTSALLYTQLATVAPYCGGSFSENVPSQFSTAPFNPVSNITSYWMPGYETVSIASRDPEITLSAWYIPSDQPDAPAVVITHGAGANASDCKRNPRALLLTGMLHRAGYNTLLIDVREHGDSTIENGRWGGGSEEYLDVLGAWDWLVTVKGFAPERIGLAGYSGGAAASMIAFGEEPRIAALWMDSMFADLRVVISDYLADHAIPTIFVDGGLFIGRLSGDDMTAFSPIGEAGRVNGRRVFITHSTADQTLSVEYARILSDAIRSAGGAVQYWETEGSLHVQYMFDHPDEYEQQLIQFFDDAL